MEFSMFDERKAEFIETYSIENKDEILWDIFNIEHSFSGRMDTPNANLFIMEAIQLIINSIELFEKGYFDCAYYSLREAIEVSTTIIYLSDLSEKERKVKKKDWVNLERFPMQKQMIKYLSTNGVMFSDMRDKLKDYFEQIDELSQNLNKIVHKQGFQHFYLSRNHPLLKRKYNSEKFKNEFLEKLRKCIGIVAVMRLAIDPFPILLMDYEIYSRCFDSITAPYTEAFVEQYIGTHIIEAYKGTRIYIEHYERLINEEQKNPTVLSIVKEQYIDTRNKDDIMAQLHLLDKWDYYATLLAINFDKVCIIYCFDGIQRYFTDRKTNRHNFCSSSEEIQNFSNSISRFNQIYDESFISVVNLEENYYLEHNELLNEEEINALKQFEEIVRFSIVKE